MTALRLGLPLFGLPLAILLWIGTASAQEGASTVAKTAPAAPAAPQDAPQAGQAAAPSTAAQPQGTAKPGDVTNPSSVEQTGTTGASGPSNEIAPAPVDEGSGWQAAVEASPSTTPLIGEEQTKAVERINAYFNNITNLQGSFEQVDSSSKQSTGRFYVQRPGKIRFDYAPPSSLRIVADGSSLAIEDSDLKTVEKYPIQSTPFRLLLSDSVDLARDSRIVGVDSQEGTLAITLEDKSGDAAGSIRLVFDNGSAGLQLKEWTITDAQGLTTQVTVTDVIAGRKVAADFFVPKDGFQPFR